MTNALFLQVFPAIRKKWPRFFFESSRNKSRPIFVQQDNARPHTKLDDVAVQEASKIGGYNIQMVCQPANSPDCNILDLGMFNSIDRIQQTFHRQSVEDLVKAVIATFNKLPSEKIDCCFLTLQSVLGKIIATDGGNDYKIPHLSKTKLIKMQGCVPKRYKLQPIAHSKAKVFHDEEAKSKDLDRTELYRHLIRENDNNKNNDNKHNDENVKHDGDE